MLRFLTAGESHGPELVAMVEGVPAGFDIDIAKINADLARRQKGYGRGGRMLIEKDEVRPVSGIRFGRTMGSPDHFHHRESRLQKLAEADVRRPQRSRRGHHRHAPAPRPCRPGRRAEVQPRRYPRRARTRVGARDDRSRRHRRADQGAARAVRHFGARILRQYRRDRGENSRASLHRGAAAHHRGIAGADGRCGSRARGHRGNRRVQENRRHAGRHRRGHRDRTAGRPRQLRAMGSQARRTPRACAAEPASRQGRRVRMGLQGGAGARLRAA